MAKDKKTPIPAIPVHEAAIRLLNENPQSHFHTLYYLYASYPSGVVVPPKAIPKLIRAFKNACKKLQGQDSGVKDCTARIIQVLKAQQAEARAEKSKKKKK